jgi:GNAT superfamily N-acetyltransferase
MNQQTYKVREPIAHDVAPVCRLAAQIGLPITNQDMQFRLNLYKEQNNKAWVIENNENDVIGCAAVHVTKVSYKNSARIVSILVDKKYRRKGIGRQLLKEAEDYAKSMGCEYVELTKNLRESNEALTFYMTLGYQNNQSCDYLEKPL